MDCLGGSLYLKEVHGKLAGTPPPVDLPHEKALQRFLCSAAAEGLLSSAHDLAEGGFACALAGVLHHAAGGPDRGEGGQSVSRYGVRPDFAMFAESQGAVLLSCPPGKKDALLDAARSLWY